MRGDDQAEVPMQGGVNTVVRVGRTVRRPTGPWTPAVHALLRHLAEAGFAGAPRVHGIDDQGREVLDFVEGMVADYPMPEEARTDQALRGVGALLRKFHDATVGFTPPPDAAWYLPPREPREVICHADVAGYNTVFREGRPVALIDFDTAHPGPRIWDVAYAAYRFVPLSASTNEKDFAAPLAQQTRRLRLFADAYGLGEADRAALPEAAVDRLRHLTGHIREQAAAGHAMFAEHLKRGDDRIYLDDADHIAQHADELRAALL
jgi:Ser/Thr protein kinase RdoA (MazF antagonist)